MIKKSKFRKFTSTLHFVQKHKFCEAQLFLQQIIKSVIKGVLFDYTSYYFHTYGTRSFLSTASVCLIPVIKCGIHFQLSFYGALNGIY